MVLLRSRGGRTLQSGLVLLNSPGGSTMQWVMGQGLQCWASLFLSDLIKTSTGCFVHFLWLAVCPFDKTR